MAQATESAAIEPWRDPDVYDSGPTRVAVIDLGSNSGRMIIVEPHALGYLHVVDEAEMPLELALLIDERSALRPAARGRLLEAMAEFVGVARGAGAHEVHIVGTAALRSAVNAPALIDELTLTFGIPVEVVDGATEARFAFLGAVYGLPVESGILIDIGGGSLEVVSFQQRALVQSWSFPLGALLLSDRFVASDPPAKAELEAIAEAVRGELNAAGVVSLKPGEHFVGTGGTIRNLAKIDVRKHRTPIGRLHGYTLRTARVRQIASQLAGLSNEKRADVPGLSAKRADFIVAGAIALHATMLHLKASRMLVSGQGLREGVARGAMGTTLPSPQQVRHESVRALTQRLTGWDRERAERRATLSCELARALVPDLPAELLEMLEHAATLLDVGSAVDFYNRHRETADMVLRTDLAGFSHAQLAALAAVALLAERPMVSIGALRPLVAGLRREIDAGAAILALADELVRRTPSGTDAATLWSTDSGTLRLRLPMDPHWQPGNLGRRVSELFGLELLVEVADA